MLAGRARPTCEVDRAYRELIGRLPAQTPAGATLCSPEAPVARDFPAPAAGGAEYFLCNGHLRDLFGELARLPARPAVQAL